MYVEMLHLVISWLWVWKSLFVWNIQRNAFGWVEYRMKSSLELRFFDDFQPFYRLSFSQLLFQWIVAMNQCTIVHRLAINKEQFIEPFNLWLFSLCVLYKYSHKTPCDCVQTNRKIQSKQRTVRYKKSDSKLERKTQRNQLKWFRIWSFESTRCKAHSAWYQ